MKNILILMLVLLTVSSCQGQEKKASERNAAAKVTLKTESSKKTDAEWKAELTADQYEILRKKGTERAFTGEYWNTFEEGAYVCAACGQKLFDSDSKFESDCGWPSFDKAVTGSVIYIQDNTYGMSRTEVICSNCQSHLGHVFEDGPRETTGDRFCTNSVSIKFIATKK
jgi:peptide-methionine (R)-S-oxide reductase